MKNAKSTPVGLVGVCFGFVLILSGWSCFAKERVAIVGAGGGVVHAAYVTMTQGARLAEATPESVAAQWAQITDRRGEIVPNSGAEQSMLIMGKLQG